MFTIEKSGFYQDNLGQSFLITQGLVGYTLVAGKQCLIRMFVGPNVLAEVDYLTLHINNTSSGKHKWVIVPKDHIIYVSDYPNGPSVGVIIRGFAFPTSGLYNLTITLRDVFGSVVASMNIFSLSFKPTMDLRFLVVFLIHQGVFTATQEWYNDVERTMLRLGSMFPVRDCISHNLSDIPRQNKGIQYAIGRPCDGYIAGYYDCVYSQTRSLNNRGDGVHVTIEYRPGFYYPQYNPPGDPSPGGNSGRPPVPYTDLRRASCVAGNWNGLEMSAGCFAQEIGHNFGLEPPNSPHYQDPLDPGHSKDSHLIDPFAYDFINNRLYNPPMQNRFLGDVMNNFAGGIFQGADYALFNSVDWEYLRLEFMKIGYSGTEINPSYQDPCGGPGISRPRLPSEIHHIIGSRAGGLQWEWTTHGFKPVPPRGPESRRTHLRNEGLLLVLKELQKQGLEDLYIVIGNHPLNIVSQVSNSFLLNFHHINIESIS
ncbi:MAG: hypothetical protein ICV53_14215, partial [Flavisolibacter sp.]|nr:hypothetical protein [Flavisolibacter sp.]